MLKTLDYRWWKNRVGSYRASISITRGSIAPTASCFDETRYFTNGPNKQWKRKEVAIVRIHEKVSFTLSLLLGEGLILR